MECLLPGPARPSGGTPARVSRYPSPSFFMLMLELDGGLCWQFALSCADKKERDGWRRQWANEQALMHRTFPPFSPFPWVALLSSRMVGLLAFVPFSVHAKTNILFVYQTWKGLKRRTLVVAFSLAAVNWINHKCLYTIYDIRFTYVRKDPPLKHISVSTSL